MNQFQRVLHRLAGRVDTPVPIVLLDVVQRNIDAMQAFATANQLDLRPHVKTHKCVEIGRLQVEAGAVGITAGNLGEVEVFADAGFQDIFLAYPLWPAGTKPARLRRLAEAVDLRVGVDDVAALDRLADAMGDAVERLAVVVEIDCGAGRSGVPPEAAGEIARSARDRGLRPVGIYTYPGQGSAAPDARERAGQEQRAALVAAVRSLEAAGVTPEVVSAGSTPTIEFSAGDPITEIRPGEYVFCDLNNVRLGACTEEQVALFVAATVVSDRVPGQVVVDAGTKALSREGDRDSGFGRVGSTDGSVLDGPALFRLNEYHGFVAVPDGTARPPLGTVLPVVPNHVCPVVNNFDELVVTDADGDLLLTWPVAARGRLG